MHVRHLLLAALALAFLVPTTLAQDLTADRATELTAEEAPARFTYSGLLTTADGAAVADGPRALVFRGYASAEEARSGAAPAWEESHEAAVVGGRFLTVLGSRDDVPEGVRYMTISVDGEAASLPVRLDRGATADSEFAPGNTLQDSYLNGRTITTGGSATAVQIQGPANTIGLTVRDVTAVFTTPQLTRFRLTSTSGGGSPGSAQIWEYRVYGSNNVEPGPGTFAIADATGGGSDGFTMFPGVSENLLNLAGTTVSVGSPTSPRDFQAYTTPNPLDPANGFVNFSVYDHAALGGSSNWREDNGPEYAFMEPDVNGSGGFFFVGAGTGAAFVVDGNNGAGTSVTIGSGASSSAFNTAATGNSSVLLPTGAIEASEISNEAGTANNNNSSTVTLSSGFNTTLSRSITAPTAGYVIAISTAEIATFHTTGSNSLLQYAVSRSCASPSAPPVTQQQNTNLPGALPTGTYTDIMSVHGLFQVNAGTTTFCNVIQLIGGTSASVDDQNLSLIFVPTAYGGIASNLTDEPGGREEADALASPALTAGDVDAERGASIQANEARVAAELAAMQARIAELEASLSNNER